MTRNDYMNADHSDRAKANAAHRAYYAQFVTPEVIGNVIQFIGVLRIKTSVDRDGAFNDIALKRWDAIPIPFGISAALKAQGDWMSQTGWVCIAKEAARQIREDSAYDVQEAR